MNALLKRARALHEAEAEAWRKAWDDYALDVGRYRAQRLGREREGRVWEYGVERLSAATDADLDAIGAIGERRRPVERARMGEERVAAWRTFAEAFSAHVAGVPDASDLARWPSGLPAPPEDPAPFIEEYVAAFDAATEEHEAMYWADNVLLECEWDYVWRRANGLPLYGLPAW